MPNKTVTFEQVPVVRKHLRRIVIEAVDEEATLFRAQVSYETRDSTGALVARKEFTKDGTGDLAAAALTALLLGINTAEGT